jgi:hypothetical protein
MIGPILGYKNRFGGEGMMGFAALYPSYKNYAGCRLNGITHLGISQEISICSKSIK